MPIWGSKLTPIRQREPNVPEGESRFPGKAKKSGKTASAEDGQPEINKSRRDADRSYLQARLLRLGCLVVHSRPLGSPMINFQVPSGWHRRTSIALLRIATVFPESSFIVTSKSVYN